MENKVLIALTETLCSYLAPLTHGYVLEKIGPYGTVVTKEVWEQLETPIKRALVIAKYFEVNELYQFSPLYGAYEDIYITITEEDVMEGPELEHELKVFAEEIIFRDYSKSESIEITKHFSISKMDA